MTGPALVTWRAAPELAALRPLAREGAVDDRPYLATLARYRTARGRESARQALQWFARLLGEEDPRWVRWYELRHEHTAVLWSLTVERSAAPATANFRRCLLSSVLEECWIAGLASLEEVTRARRMRRAGGSRVPRGRHVELQELRRVLARCHDRDQALICLLYGGGLRRAELAAAELADLRLPPGTTGTLRVVGKGDRERLCELPGGTVRALRAWLEVRGAEPGPLFLRVTRRGIPTPAREGLTPAAVSTQVRRLCRRAGLVHTTPHDLRRTFAGELLDLAVDLSTVQGMMGHASPSTTARYDRRDGRARAGAAARFYVPTRDEA